MKNVLKTPDTNIDADKRLGSDIDRLGASIQRFRIDSQRFFAGDLRFPPAELRDRIVADLRRLRGSNLKGAAASFRLGTLEAQFQSYVDLFGRRLRKRELGEVPPAADVPGTASADPQKGVVIGERESPAAVEALYRTVRRHNPEMDLDRFRIYIHRQAEVIRTKTGCSEIQFRVAVQDGKMKLKAKPVRSKTSPQDRESVE